MTRIPVSWVASQKDRNANEWDCRCQRGSEQSLNAYTFRATSQAEAYGYRINRIRSQGAASSLSLATEPAAEEIPHVRERPAILLDLGRVLLRCLFAVCGANPGVGLTGLGADLRGGVIRAVLGVADTSALPVLIPAPAEITRGKRSLAFEPATVHASFIG